MESLALCGCACVACLWMALGSFCVPRACTRLDEMKSMQFVCSRCSATGPHRHSDSAGSCRILKPSPRGASRRGCFVPDADRDLRPIQLKPASPAPLEQTNCTNQFKGKTDLKTKGTHQPDGDRACAIAVPPPKPSRQGLDPKYPIADRDRGPIQPKPATPAPLESFNCANPPKGKTDPAQGEHPTMKGPQPDANAVPPLKPQRVGIDGTTLAESKPPGSGVDRMAVPPPKPPRQGLDAKPKQGLDTKPPKQGLDTKPAKQESDAKPPKQRSDTKPPKQGSDAKPPKQGSDTKPPKQRSDTKPPKQGSDLKPPKQGSDPKHPIADKDRRLIQLKPATPEPLEKSDYSNRSKGKPGPAQKEDSKPKGAQKDVDSGVPPPKPARQGLDQKHPTAAAPKATFKTDSRSSTGKKDAKAADKPSPADGNKPKTERASKKEPDQKGNNLPDDCDTKPMKSDRASEVLVGEPSRNVGTGPREDSGSVHEMARETLSASDSDSLYGSARESDSDSMYESARDTDSDSVYESARGSDSESVFESARGSDSDSVYETAMETMGGGNVGRTGDHVQTTTPRSRWNRWRKRSWPMEIPQEDGLQMQSRRSGPSRYHTSI